MSRKRGYERIHSDVARALARGELSFRQFGILCYLALAADYQTEPPEIMTTVLNLQDQLDLLDCDHDEVYEDLHFLAGEKWIAYTTRTGPKPRYIIHVLRRTIPPRWKKPAGKLSGNSTPESPLLHVPGGKLTPPTSTTPSPTPSPSPAFSHDETARTFWRPFPEDPDIEFGDEAA